MAPTSPDVFRRHVASVNVLASLSSVDHMTSLADWAEELARKILEVPLPRRWAHVQGVARRARSIAHILGEDADLLEAAAWLHDIGYSPELVVTGFHPLDGARYLRHVQHAEEQICRLVARHSCAIIEAEERELADELSREFPPADPALSDALAYCDMTTTPTGNRISVDDRLSEIRERYGPHSIVTRFIHKAEPDLVSSVSRTIDRLSLVGQAT
jgi:HD superfamily phosphodiesterase